MSSNGVSSGSAAGKVILLGEHAVVYGKHALAVPIKNAMVARYRKTQGSVVLNISAWEVNQSFDQQDDSVTGAASILQLLLAQLNVPAENIEMKVETLLPVAQGLGSSAALAVSMARALSAQLELDLSDDEINQLTFECEKLAHGRPSGIDNTIAVYGQPLLYRKKSEPVRKSIDLQQSAPLVIACSGKRGMTRDQVAGVRNRYEGNRSKYEAVFDEMDQRSLAGCEALINEDYDALGTHMNSCHELLKAIEVSTPELDAMVLLAKEAGAVGAKLTGAGGGGSIVALCPGSREAVSSALSDAGYQTLQPG